MIFDKICLTKFFHFKFYIEVGKNSYLIIMRFIEKRIHKFERSALVTIESHNNIRAVFNLNIDKNAIQPFTNITFIEYLYAEFHKHALHFRDKYEAIGQKLCYPE